MLDHSPTFVTRTLPSGSPRRRDLVQPHSGVQARAESVAAPLVSAHPSDIEVLTYLQPVDTVGDLAVGAGLLDART
jgi:hypothetical protein